MSNDYFCTVAEKLIGPADKIQPLHAHSRQNVDIPTTTSITISQMEIEEKICSSLAAFFTDLHDKVCMYVCMYVKLRGQMTYLGVI